VAVGRGDAAEQVVDVLRLHHHELHEALRHLGVANRGIVFLELSHASKVARVSTVCRTAVLWSPTESPPYFGETVAMT
jgi:hypothetical protein